jgi:hypothetical protein
MLAALNPSGSYGWSTLKASFSQLSAPDFGSMLARVTPSSFNWQIVLMAATLMLLLKRVPRGIAWYRTRPKTQTVNMTINLLPSPVEAPIVLPQMVEPAAPEEQATEDVPGSWVSWEHAKSLADASDKWIAERFPNLLPKSATA